MEIVKNDFVKLTRQLSEKYGGKPLITFFDDLDRCLPEKALDLLEALKNLFVVKDARVLFISGIDTQVAKQFIIKRYEGLDESFAYNYFKKIFNFTVNISQLTKERFKTIVSKRLKELFKGDSEEFNEDKYANEFSGILVEGGIKSFREAFNILHNFYFLFVMQPELKEQYLEYLILYTIREIAPGFFALCCGIATKLPDQSFAVTLQQSPELEEGEKNLFLTALLNKLKNINLNFKNFQLLYL